MLLNSFEKALMNNPIRAMLQRRFEAARLLKMGGKMPGEAALEIGCGRGVGVEIIFAMFGAKHVRAFDLDVDMVRQASQRLRARRDRVVLWQGDATAIPARDESYDAVFDFGIIHHVPNWRDALREIHRVLKPGGRFYAEEMLARGLLHPVSRWLFDHPLEDRFDHDAFRDALSEAGYRVTDSRHLFNYIGWFVAEKRVLAKGSDKEDK